MSQQKTGGLEEAKTYMRDKEIPQLFESMMTALMYKKPENHLVFLEECLVKAKKQPKVKWHTFIEPLPPIPRTEKELKSESEINLPDSKSREEPKIAVRTYSPLPAITPNKVQEDHEEIAIVSSDNTPDVPSSTDETNAESDVAPVVTIDVEDNTHVEEDAGVIPTPAIVTETNVSEEVKTEITTDVEIVAETTESPNVETKTEEITTSEVETNASEEVKTEITIDLEVEAETAVSADVETKTKEIITPEVETNASEEVKTEITIDMEAEAETSESAIVETKTEEITKPEVETNASEEVKTEVTTDVEVEAETTERPRAETTVETERITEPEVETNASEEVKTEVTTGEEVEVVTTEESSNVETETEEIKKPEVETEVTVTEDVATVGEDTVTIEKTVDQTTENVADTNEPAEKTEVSANDEIVVPEWNGDGVKEEVDHSPAFDKPVIFVLGGPGSGKGTQCTQIVEKFNYLHLSAGDLLRKEAAEKGGELAEIMKQGQLVPQEVTIGLLKQAMLDNVESKGFLIDGFPREIQQGLTFENEVTSPTLVLNYSCPDDILTERLVARGKHSGRVDDNEESIKKRLELFHQVSEPVISHYGDKVKTIDSSQDIDLVFAATSNELEQIQSVVEEKIVPVEEIIIPGQGSAKHLLGDNIIIFVLGGPGSGKGTQCAKIVEKYNYCHLSTGDLLRQEIQEVKSGRRFNESQRANALIDIMNNGELVPQEVILQLLQEAMLAKEDCKGFLIDGFPRDIEQGLLFEDTIGKCTCVLYFKCSEECMTERLLVRAETSGRSDDNIDTIKLRLTTFTEQTVPVVEKFKDRLKEVNAERGVEEIFTDVCEHLDNL